MKNTLNFRQETRLVSFIFRVQCTLGTKSVWLRMCLKWEVVTYPFNLRYVCKKLLLNLHQTRKPSISHERRGLMKADYSPFDRGPNGDELNPNRIIKWDEPLVREIFSLCRTIYTIFRTEITQHQQNRPFYSVKINSWKMKIGSRCQTFSCNMSMERFVKEAFKIKIVNE